jgi:hypothetical protein
MGKWNFNEKNYYSQFLDLNYDAIQSKRLRRTKKIFIQMSKFVKTRNPDQCRSHHQKMIKLYHSIPEIQFQH